MWLNLALLLKFKCFLKLINNNSFLVKIICSGSINLVFSLFSIKSSRF